MQSATSSVDESQQAEAWFRARMVLCAFFTVIVMMFSLILYSETLMPQAAVIGAADQDLRVAWRGLLRLFLLAVSTPVMLLLAGPLVSRVTEAKHWLEAPTELLILLGALAAYGLSVVNTFADTGHVYFETATGILTLTSLGRSLQVQSRRQAVDALSLISKDLAPELTVLEPSGDSQARPLAEIKKGERVCLLPGDVVSLDGVVEEGQSAVEKSRLNGEFLAQDVAPGDWLFAGSRVLSGRLTVRVERELGGRLIDQIEDSLKAALAEPGQSVALAESLARWLLPVAVVIAAGAGLFHSWLTGPLAGFHASLSVLLIACPCSLGLATPLALWLGIRRSAQHGVVFKTGQALEQLAQVDTVVFDKTGTLSTGALVLDSALYLPDDEARAVARALVQHSQHPVSKALLRAFEESENECFELQRVEEHAGLGLSGQWLGGAWRLGRRGFLELNDCDAALGEDLWRGSQKTCVGLSCDGELRALWSLSEELRPDLSELFVELQSLNLDLFVLTGDRKESAENSLGRFPLKIHADLSAPEKLQLIRDLASKRQVLMLGDGFNDAPALAAAQVGVALSSGVELSRQSADAVILEDQLRSLPEILSLSRETRQRIQANLSWACFYNSVGLILAATGQLNPVVAALAMVLSSLTIVSSTLSSAELGDRSEQGRLHVQPVHVRPEGPPGSLDEPLQEAAQVPRAAACP